MKSILILLFVFHPFLLMCQIQEDKAWCKLNCDAAFHTENAELIYLQIQNDSTRKILEAYDSIRFPLRFVFVEESFMFSDDEKIQTVNEVITQLNYSFKDTKFVFDLHQIEEHLSNLKIEDLSQNIDNIYDDFSEQNDLQDIISVYILNHNKEFCTVTASSISCARTGGFSYILSDRTNNIVMSRFDLKNPKIVAHEFGHFFGLYHTFEEQLFGKDTFNTETCYVSGDRICDTSPDPGSVFEIYVNYSTCEMIGLSDQKGNEYKPMLDNYMSYYKPCYLKEYSFTKEQEMAMKLASRLNIRKKFSRPILSKK